MFFRCCSYTKNEITVILRDIEIIRETKTKKKLGGDIDGSLAPHFHPPAARQKYDIISLGEQQ